MKEVNTMLNIILSSGTDSLTYESLLVLALVLVLGMYAGKIFERFRLPHITGYILMGVIIGLFLVLFGFEDIISHLQVVSSVALGFIAFGIGMELDFMKLKKSGKEVVVITIVQAVMASLITIVLVLLTKTPLHIALVLGAIATATAPAPIMLLTRKYRTRGPLTDTLLPLVGMDDAVGIVLFGIFLSIANSIKNGSDLSIVSMLEGPLLELVFSAIIGILVGFVSAELIRRISNKEAAKEEVFLAVTIFAVFVTVAFSKMDLAIGDFEIHLSAILTPMILGVVLTNRLSRVRSHDVNLAVESFSGPILIAFFTLAGSELVVALHEHADNFNLWNILGVTTVYVIARAIGKVYGAHLGGKIMKSHRNVRRYLGLCLLPQAGVALGMAYQARNDFGDAGIQVLIIVLIATLIYEIFGPFGVKFALEKSGEIRSR